MYEANHKASLNECGAAAASATQSEIHEQLFQLTLTAEELDNVIGRLTVRMQPVTNDMLAPKEGTGCTAIPRASLSPLGEALRDRQEYMNVQVQRLESLLQRLAV